MERTEMTVIPMGINFDSNILSKWEQ